MPDSAPACRELCLAQGEPLAGSAGAASDWIGIAWPKPRWHDDSALLSDGLPAALLDLEKEARQRGRKLAARVFQRQSQAGIERTELVLWSRGVGVKLRDVPVVRAPELILRHLDGETLADAEPLVGELFVCTDGKHDPCCARLGRPLYDALRAAIEQTGAEIGVAECSHLGGHRFAANVLALPQGVLYGRVEAAEAERLLAAMQRGEVLPARLRGRLGQGELMQVAESQVRESTGFRAGIEIIGVREGADGARVELRLDDGRRLWVRCERRVYRGPVSCGADEPEAEQTRWLGVELGEA